ncbi:MAG: serine/threonine-protein kinase [Gammaproteobacteria bacterium]
MRLIIVDTSRTFMAALRQHVAAAFPASEITEYDAEQQGPPAADFDWCHYDFAVLGHDLGNGVRGLDWLRTHGRTPGLPPLAFIAEGGDEYLAAAAIKAGALEYFRRADTIGDRLVETLRALPARSAGDATHVLHAAPGDAPVALLDATGHRFVRLIGQGGFSRVYLAERRDDATPLVMKVIDTQRVADPAIVRRFVREAEIMADIDDPHVVRVFDQGFTETYGYISMEFFRRGDLKRRLEHGVSPARSVELLRGIACALRAIHRRGVIHRDVKPANLMFRDDDSLVLADFGISCRLAESSELTRHTGAVGTPSYISPEQACGRAVDGRSDLYSAGVVFFELLTGHKPYRADTAEGVVYQHLHAPVPRLPADRAALQPLVDLLLAKDPKARFASADDLLEGLAGWVPPESMSRLAPTKRAA